MDEQFYDSFLHFAVSNNREATILQAIELRRWVECSYRSAKRTDDPKGAIQRCILPFKAWKSREGVIIVQAYDTYRGNVRAFRLDRFEGEMTMLGTSVQRDEDPAVLRWKNGTVTIWPVAWNLHHSRPQQVPKHSAARFLAHGWALVPPTWIVEEPCWQ